MSLNNNYVIVLPGQIKGVGLGVFNLVYCIAVFIENNRTEKVKDKM